MEVKLKGLRLNVNKTRGMVIDIRRKTMCPQPLCTRERLWRRRRTTDNWEWWSTTNCTGRLIQRLCTRRGKSRLFPEEAELLQCVQQDVGDVLPVCCCQTHFFFAVVCWSSNIRACDTNRLDKMIKKAGSVLGLKLESLETVVESKMLNEIFPIIDNDQHPLHHTVDRQQGSFFHRLPQLSCQRNRYKKSFLPQAITLYNNNNYWRNWS